MNYLTPTRMTSILLCFCFLTACNSDDDAEQRQTLQSLESPSPLIEEAKKKVDLKNSEDDIRDAYINYLKHSSKKDLSRSAALNRLANIEFQLSEQLLNETPDEQVAAQLATLKLNRVIALLETSLTDYPDAKNNDVTLYQLAKAYDQKGLYEETHTALQKLAEKYPHSTFYLESQFRLAEYAFTKRHYGEAEDKYTEIIISKNNNVFYEKALYKRGWARFKQQFYIEAADDFVRAINLNNFSEYKQLNGSSKNLFDEYFRALALSFSYLEGAKSLNTYLKDSEYQDNDYYIYESLSAVFLKQQQYNDAVSTLHSFMAFYPESSFAPQAGLKIIDIWKEAGFVEKRSVAFEQFYQVYQPNSEYWKNNKNINKAIQNQTNLSLKAHILTETATYHKRYQQNKKYQDFLHAQRWYQNYLTDFQHYAHKDNIHLLFASLYSDYGDTQNAIKYYQLAGFDEQTIIDKSAAYQSILLSSVLHQENKEKPGAKAWLTKLINYSILYAQQYPNDKQTLKIIAHASNIAYQNKQYSDTIALAELASSSSSSAILSEISNTKANAYFHNAHYELAEDTYLQIINDKSLTQGNKKEAYIGLSLAIYYQGNNALKNNKVDQAIGHYARIIDVAPKTEAAASGLFDAISISIKHKNWLTAITYIKTFKKLYPSHQYTTDVTKKLSVAYLNSKQDVAAARELEKLSNKDDSDEYKMVSLLKAAQLYQNNNEVNAAIRSYTKYADNYTKPFPTYLESLYQLSLLTIQNDANKQSLIWSKKILDTEKRTANNLKTPRTNFIASNAAIALAREQHQAFSRIELRQPLKKHLKNKKKTMTASVNYYAKASSFGIAETATEATYSIAKIYNDFSQSLLNSEVPKQLNEDEQEEYMFLLEDQAFPFEEKAIEFYEINLLYSNDGIYDQWLEKSLKELQVLFPIRYQRKPKLESIINVLH